MVPKISRSNRDGVPNLMGSLKFYDTSCTWKFDWWNSFFFVLALAGYILAKNNEKDKIMMFSSV